MRWLSRERRRPVAALLTNAAVGVMLVMAAPPAAAHDPVTTTTIAPSTTPTVAMTGGHETMPVPAFGAGAPPVTAATTSSVGDSALSRALYVVAVFAATTAAALAFRRLRQWTVSSVERRPVNDALAAALVFAGVAHCAVTPSHWAEGWHLGLFFAASGFLLVGQGLFVWTRPSAAVYGSIVVANAALITLYFLAREFALPLVGHRDPYVFEEYPVKLAEAVAAVLALTALAPRWTRPRRTPLAATGGGRSIAGLHEGERLDVRKSALVGQSAGGPHPSPAG